MPNKISQLLQEFKRRKVFRVIVMYAGAAYIIIELVNNVAEPLHLPEWTATLVILLLIIGFPIVAILSWIFDITHEGIKKTEPTKDIKLKETASKPAKRKLRVSDIIIAVLIVVVVVLVYPKIFKKDKFGDIRDEDGRISIAVMPFENQTGDTLYSGMELGMQNLLITKLSNSDDLAVRQTQTMYEILRSTRHQNYASFTPSEAKDIALKLDVNTVILGSIHKSGKNLRIIANLLNSKSEEIYKSFEIDSDSEDDFFIITDSLTGLIKNHLEIKILDQVMDQETRLFAETGSAEAYRYFSQGLNKFYTMDFDVASDLFEIALEKDPDFFDVVLWLIPTYIITGKGLQARQLTEHYFKQIDHYPYAQQVMIKYYKSSFEKNPLEVIKYAKLRIEEDPLLRTMWYALGSDYLQIEQYGDAIIAFEKALEIDRNWGGGWVWVLIYVDCGRAYHETGKHDREKEIYEMGLSVLPDNPWIVFRQAVCALSLGDTIEANDYIAKYKSIGETENWGEYWINCYTAWIYQEAKQFNKAADIYRDLIEQDPLEPWSSWQLGFILIDNEINVDEGMKLIDKALGIEPGNWEFLYTKGLGYFKQGKFEEAYQILRGSWDMRPEYNHDHYLLLQEVKQALARQNGE